MARNRLDASVHKAHLRRYGVQAESAAEGVSDGPEGIIFESTLDGMTGCHGGDLAQNVMHGMEAARSSAAETT